MNKEKILSLQALRAFAFIGIMLSHVYIIELGAWGVSIFFMLTGFLFTYNYYSSTISLSVKSMLFFSLKRIAKLYPLHICMLIVLIPLSGWTYNTLFADIKGFFLHVFLLQSLFKEREIVVLYNGPAWYLSCMLFIYFFVPIILVFIKNYKNTISPIILSIILFALQIFMDSIAPIYGYVFPLSRIIDVIIGCNLGYLYLNYTNSSYNEFRYTIYEIMAIAFAIISEYLFLKVCKSNHEIFIPSSMALVYIFAMKKGYISKLITNKILIYLGNISPYGFLIHNVVNRYLIVFNTHILHMELNNYMFFAFSFALTIICSEAWKCIENLVKVKSGGGGEIELVVLCDKINIYCIIPYLLVQNQKKREACKFESIGLAEGVIIV